MAFEVEMIDEETRSKLKVELRKYQIVLGMSYRKLVDHERDIVFYLLGGRGNQPAVQDAPPDHYLLFYKKQPVAFETRENVVFVEGRAEAEIQIECLKLPRALEADYQQVKDIVEEALTANCHIRWKRPVVLQLSFPQPFFGGGLLT